MTGSEEKAALEAFRRAIAAGDFTRAEDIANKRIIFVQNENSWEEKRQRNALAPLVPSQKYLQVDWLPD